MKFIYGKNDWKTLERGQENCYLLTNGLGGFSSGTMVGSNTRNDHALFMACTKAPNKRMHMVTKIEESIEKNGQVYDFACQEYEKDRALEGQKFLNSFAFEYVPQWTYQAAGVEVIKTVCMKQQENTLAVQYTVYNHGKEEVTLFLKPYFQFVPKGEVLSRKQKFELTENCIKSGEQVLYYKTDGTVSPYPTEYEELYYSYDVCDGRKETGLAACNHRISFTVGERECRTCQLIYSTDPVREDFGQILEGELAYQKALEEKSGFTSPLAKHLARSANQFVANRESTGGRTILAGYPFFEDWGRDTMIALTGCSIVTGQREDAKSILRTFMKYCRRGIMPNLFPEGGNEPMYNTVDAALLFINGVYEYYRAFGEKEFIREAYPVMESIVQWYQKGTDFGIHADEDGLIMAGQGFDQVTWMDVRIGDILPTPRHGKPVEINAYWYNALKILEEFTQLLGEKEAMDYGKMAEKVKKSFCEKFWNPKKGCLKDLVSGEKADFQIRCNQIWAVSLPYTMLPAEQEKQVVETVFEKLYTPYGLRTLDPEDEQYQGTYGGKQLQRDLAYHQGTTWAFPMGGYYLAYLKVHGYSKESVAQVKRQLEVLDACLREGCVGQIPEIYDGDNLSRSHGCFAQAWSTAEFLRVFHAVEKTEGLQEDFS